jgi:hypothetical protein
VTCSSTANRLLSFLNDGLSGPSGSGKDHGHPHSAPRTNRSASRCGPTSLMMQETPGVLRGTAVSYGLGSPRPLQRAESAKLTGRDTKVATGTIPIPVVAVIERTGRGTNAGSARAPGLGASRGPRTTVLQLLSTRRALSSKLSQYRSTLG